MIKSMKMHPCGFEKSDMIALVARQLEGYNNRDIDSFCACYHPEVRVEWLISKQFISKGITSFWERYRELFRSSPALHCTLKSRVVIDDCVVDEEIVRGLNGRTEGVHVFVIYGFRDGLIDRVWFLR